MKKIALFFDRTYVDAHSCFTELAKHLSASGYEIDLYHLPNAFSSFPAFYDSKIRLLTFPRSRFEKADFWYKLFFVKEYKYSAVIGTPFGGVFLARKVAGKLNIPMIYLADEVFNPDLNRHNFPNYSELKKRDILANRYATATIALGEERYEYQRKVNRLDISHKHFIIPNSPAGQSEQLKSNYFRDTFNISDSKPIVLFIGTLGWRLARKLYEESKQFTEKPYHLIFHARGLGEIGDEKHPFIKISKTPVCSNMLNYVVSSAEIGLVLYDKDDIAEAENALTGGKIGTYLKNNLPLIAGNAEGLRLLENKGLGVYIENTQQLDRAVDNISSHKNLIKQNIKEKYRFAYSYSEFYKPFENFLNEITK